MIRFTVMYLNEVSHSLHGININYNDITIPPIKTSGTEGQV